MFFGGSIGASTRGESGMEASTVSPEPAVAHEATRAKLDMNPYRNTRAS
jgi:hypothetical protein